MHFSFVRLSFVCFYNFSFMTVRHTHINCIYMSTEETKQKKNEANNGSRYVFHYVHFLIFINYVFPEWPSLTFTRYVSRGRWMKWHKKKKKSRKICARRSLLWCAVYVRKSLEKADEETEWRTWRKNCKKKFLNKMIKHASIEWIFNNS